MAEPNGPVVHVPGDVAVTSRLLGLPVVNDDGCPRSIQMRERVRELFGPS